MSLLELQNITKDFPGVRALDGVSFSLEKGEIHALCGENGAGKSTLIKILCGVHPAGSYGGEVILDGVSVRFRNLKDSEKRGLALIAQELALVPELSVAENILLGREILKRGLIDWPETRREAARTLALAELSVDPSRPVRELGVGQQQMVEIAKALSKKAGVLVLDEPTAALTESDARRLLTFLRQLKSQGVSCIYISHRLEEVFQVADRVTVLRDGVSVATAPVSAITKEQVIAHMVGREVKDLYPRPPEGGGGVLLEVRGLSVEDPDNPGRYVVRDVSFSVGSGEVVAVAGLMGAGRTALLSSLFGAARGGASGRILLEGRERGLFSSPREAIAHGVALVSEDRKRYGLVPEATVGDNLSLATVEKRRKGFLVDHARLREECDEQVKALRIKTPSLGARADQLSGGNQQKVVLGKWLMTHPKVLFLDEPTRGIDVGAKAEIYDLVNLLARRGVGIVLVSSDLPELLGLSHRLIVLNQGRLTAALGHAEATPEKVLAAAALGTNASREGPRDATR
jgi:D-xylose transport system ATP-binding protein